MTYLFLSNSFKPKSDLFQPNNPFFLFASLTPSFMKKSSSNFARISFQILSLINIIIHGDKINKDKAQNIMLENEGKINVNFHPSPSSLFFNESTIRVSLWHFFFLFKI